MFDFDMENEDENENESRVERVIGNAFRRYLLAYDAREKYIAKACEAFLADLFFLQTGMTQHRDPAGYLAWWSKIAEANNHKRNFEEREQKKEALIKLTTFVARGDDGEFDEFPIADNEELTVTISSIERAALTVRTQETGESEREIIERLIRAEWVAGATENPDEWKRNFDDIAF